MDTALSLPELQRQFMAALYDAKAPGPLACIAGNGLEPEARLRIYRRSCNETQTAALRTAYPAVLALVGDAFFDQMAGGYRRGHPSHSGNLQVFGNALAEYIETLPTCSSLSYLPDVARFEWLRQLTILAPDCVPIDVEVLAEAIRDTGDSLRLVLHPSLHRLDSHYPVLTLWNYALRPTDEKLTLGDAGESVALWREGGEVAAAALDPATFACITALGQGSSLGEAYRIAASVDPEFDLDTCLESLCEHGLVGWLRPYIASHVQSPTC